MNSIVKKCQDGFLSNLIMKFILRLIIFLSIFLFSFFAEGANIGPRQFLFPFDLDNLFFYLEPIEICNNVFYEKFNDENYNKRFVILTSYGNNKIAQRFVHKYINIFTTKNKKTFTKWLQESGKYIDTIKEILKQEGLPEELAYLPLIESGFNTSVKSYKNAVGPWQFISSTAKQYGLKINYWIDERRDPEKSTRAAARYLKNLYKMFGSWELALASYNAGEGKIQKAIKELNTNNYWKILTSEYLKKETQNYVAKFIAAGIIASNPEEYGFDEVDIHPPLKYEKIKIKKPASISFIAKCADVSESVIKELNPELKRWCTPLDTENYYILKIPEGIKESFLECFNSADNIQRMSYILYTIKKGDSIYKITKKFNISKTEIFIINKGINPKKLKPGSIIYLPPY